MRGYECYYYSMRQDGVLLHVGNKSCWKGMDSSNIRYDIPIKERIVGHFNDSIYSKNIIFNEENKDYIFIDKFKEEIPIKTIERLLFIINKITPCSIVTINEVEYIKYKLLDTYAKNLVLLNFIRKLWYKPAFFNHNQFFKDIFKDLKYKEPLRFLMTCLRDNVIINDNGGYASYGGHSNVYKDIIPKTRRRLFEYNGEQMETFMKAK